MKARDKGHTPLHVYVLQPKARSVLFRSRSVAAALLSHEGVTVSASALELQPEKHPSFERLNLASSPYSKNSPNYSYFATEKGNIKLSVPSLAPGINTCL